MTGKPNILFPIEVLIRPIAKAATRYDHLRREPVNTVTRATTVAIQAQVVWADRFRPIANMPFTQPAGTDERQWGYLVVTKDDLASKAWVPQRGDEIIQMGTRIVQLYVINITHHATTTDGDFQLSRIEFTDRRSESGG